MRQYLDLLETVLTNGTVKRDRTGTGTISSFGHQMKFDLQKSFPLVTTKKTHMKSIIHELIWFLSGSGNIQYLKDNNVSIWDDWADENGDLGPVYGVQWRKWETYEEAPVVGRVYIPGKPIDQIAEVINAIKTNPNSRRLIVSAWNPAKVDQMALPPCHSLFQFYVANGKLSCQLYQRSADLFLGVPFNIASYALLTHMVAQVCGLGVGEFSHVFGDAHIYLNHVDQVKLQLSRTPFEGPRLVLDPSIKSIDDFRFEHVSIENYQAHPHIKGAISV